MFDGQHSRFPIVFPIEIKPVTIRETQRGATYLAKLVSTSNFTDGFMMEMIYLQLDVWT